MSPRQQHIVGERLSCPIWSRTLVNLDTTSHCEERTNTRVAVFQMNKNVEVNHVRTSRGRRLRGARLEPNRARFIIIVNLAAQIPVLCLPSIKPERKVGPKRKLSRTAAGVL